MTTGALDGRAGPCPTYSPGSTPLLAFPFALAILAQPHLQEHEPGGDHQPETDQDQGQDLPRPTTDQHCQHHPDDEKRACGTKAHYAVPAGHP